MQYYGVLYGQRTEYGDLVVGERVTDERANEVRENIDIDTHKERCLTKWHEQGLKGFTFEEAMDRVKKLEKYLYIERSGIRLPYLPGLHDIQLVTWKA